MVSLAIYINQLPRQITQNIGKTYNAPKITYTRKAHYSTNFTFPHFQNVWLRLPTLQRAFP